MQAASKQRNTKATMAATNLFERFDTFTSNSGGSWFMSQLAYSKSFLSLIEAVAGNPNSAGATYNNNWVQPLVKSKPKNNFIFQAFLALLKTTGSKGKGVAQTLEQVSDFMSKGLTFGQFIANIMQRTAGVSTSTRFGDPVNSWAKGKKWVVAHSMLTPGGSCSYCNKDARFWNKDARSWGDYILSSRKNQPLYTPVSFSIKLGSGRGSKSPLPYCAPGMCNSLKMKYESNTWAGFYKSSKTGTVKTSDYEKYAGQLPLYQVIAASSAVFGGFITSSAKMIVDPDFAVWSSSSGPDPFSNADSVINRIKKRQQSVLELSE